MLKPLRVLACFGHLCRRVSCLPVMLWISRCGAVATRRHGLSPNGRSWSTFLTRDIVELHEDLLMTNELSSCEITVGCVPACLASFAWFVWGGQIDAPLPCHFLLVFLYFELRERYTRNLATLGYSCGVLNQLACGSTYWSSAGWWTSWKLHSCTEPLLYQRNHNHTELSKT